MRQTRRHCRGLPVEKIRVNSGGGSRCSATTFTPPSEMSVITQSRGKEPVPTWIFARVLHRRRSALRRLAANISIFYPVHTVRSVGSLDLQWKRWNRPIEIDRNRRIEFDPILAITRPRATETGQMPLSLWVND